jgi:hypothetical protein
VVELTSEPQLEKYSIHLGLFLMYLIRTFATFNLLYSKINAAAI